MFEIPALLQRHTHTLRATARLRFSSDRTTMGVRCICREWRWSGHTVTTVMTSLCRSRYLASSRSPWSKPTMMRQRSFNGTFRTNTSLCWSRSDWQVLEQVVSEQSPTLWVGFFWPAVVITRWPMAVGNTMAVVRVKFLPRRIFLIMSTWHPALI